MTNPIHYAGWWQVGEDSYTMPIGHMMFMSIPDNEKTDVEGEVTCKVCLAVMEGNYDALDS